MNLLSRNLALSVPDPALASTWILKVPFADFTVQVVAEKVQPTFHKTPATPRFAQGTNTYYPGVTDIDGLSCTFYETHDLQVSQWLYNWRRLVYEPDTGVYGMPAVYKQDVIIDYYEQGNSSPVRSARYIGIWPTDEGPYPLDYESGEGRIQIEAQFSCDDMRWE